MGWLSKYPRLTAAIVSSNPPHAIATAKGHLDQTRQVKQARRRTPSCVAPLAPSPVGDDPPPADVDLCIKTYILDDPLHADLTARFPVASRKGNQYLLVVCWHGYCHFEPMPSRTADSYVKAHNNVLVFFRALGRNPTILRLDNETSNKLELYLKSEHVQMQYVAPGTHRANKAERAIRTSKNHLISILCGTHPDCPLDLWDEFLEQAELAFAHLQPYTLDPSLCAYDGFHATRYDFVAHPIAPPGTLVVVHEKPAARGTWAPHGAKGYYLGPAVQHYHCWRTWILTTSSERISDTLQWFPIHVPLPGRNPHAMVTAAIHDLITAAQSLQATAQVPRATLQSHVLSATEELRAVIAIFEPPDPAAPPAVPAPGSLPQRQRVPELSAPPSPAPSPRPESGPS